MLRTRIGLQFTLIFSGALIFSSWDTCISAMTGKERLHFGAPQSKEPTPAVGAQVQSPQGSAMRLLSVRLVPDNVTLWGAKASQRFLVLGKYADGLEREVTAESHFQLSDEWVVRVDEGGRVVALGNGEAELSAEIAGQVAQTHLRVVGWQEQRPFSFGRDIGGIFTKRGCNSSDCHGSVKGKGGFKLSMNALYPQDDYQWIVEGGVYQVLSAESKGARHPRINQEESEKSLLLLKSTNLVAHGGGRRFSVDSSDYATILKWIEEEAPYGEESQDQSVQIEQLEVFPREGVLDRKGKQQLLVTAHLSNGHREDVTDQVLYVSNNPEVVEVTPQGLVRAVQTGETTVMIRAAGQVVTTIFGVITQPMADYPEVERRNLIDEQVFSKLRKFNILPSGLSSDGEFLRRVCLDMTGTLPPPERVREFLASKDSEKRDKLIEVLLNSPEYVDYWTFRFADLFRVAYAPLEDMHYGQMYWEWIRQSIVENKPYNRIARERIAAQGYTGASRHYHYENGELPTPQDMIAEELRVFMGRRLDCAQCHDHPYESWSQDQFWGMAAFFGRLTRLGDIDSKDPSPTSADIVIFDDPGGREEVGQLGQGARLIHPRTKQVVEPRFLDGKPLAEEKRVDLRMALAEWMTSHPYFAEASVNRMWGYFFGRGIVEPVDDFRALNSPTHPDLLAVLARDFKEHDYDLKHLVRLIVQSRTYQLSSRPNQTSRNDGINYSRAIPRPLDAEVLLDAISYVTGVPEVFDLEGRLGGGRAPIGTRAINLKIATMYPSQFLEVYERPNRLTLPERRVKANLAQALHMLAGSSYVSKIAREGGRLDRLLKKNVSNGEIIEAFYLAALSRVPTQEEQVELEEKISQRVSRREALEDFVWAVISSREFAYRH